MTTIEELTQGRVRRLEVYGPTGSGKTKRGVQVAANFAAQGFNSLYLDLLERSAVEELLLLAKKPNGKDLLARILWKPVNDYATAFQFAQGILTLPPDRRVKLVVIDAAHHIIKLARRHTREQIKKAGGYFMGEKWIPLEDPTNFELRGYLYGQANNRIDEFVDALLVSGADIIFLVNKDELSETNEGLFDGYADSMLASTFTTDDKGRRNWFLAPTKHRGDTLSNYSKVHVPREMDAFQFLDMVGTMKPEEYTAFVAACAPTTGK